MLLGSQTNPINNIQAKGDNSLAAALIGDGRYAEAYAVLKGLPGNGAAESYNLALCCIYGGDHAQALTHIEKSLAALRGAVAAPAHTDMLSAAIVRKQATAVTYMMSVTDEYVRLFPDFVRDSALRLMVDCHAALEQWPEVVRVAALIVNKSYANVERALRCAQNGE